MKPQSYSEVMSGVELVETHISHLFLTGEHVYKVKKAVDYGFLDFTTLENRRFYGYYTIHTLRDGNTAGMLSINGYTQEAFLHFWHGDFVNMATQPHDE